MKRDDLDRIFDQALLHQTADAPSAASLEQIGSRITSNLKPVRPLAASGYLFAAFIGIMALVVAAGVYRIGTGGLSAMNALQAGSVFLVLLLSIVLAADALIRQMIPGSRRWISQGPLLTGILLAIFLVFAALFRVQPDPKFWTEARWCLTAGTLAGAITGVLSWFVLRRGAILSPRLAGATAGLLAGLTSITLQEIYCPNLDVLHILTAHFGTMLICTLAGATIGFIAEARR